MRRVIRFTVLCSEPEREQLSQLAEHLSRTQGDTVRLALRKLATDSGITASQQPTPNDGETR